MTVARKRNKRQKSTRSAARLKREALPDKGIAGADSTRLVTQELIASAVDVLASLPRFWGRYFKGPGNTNPVQYQARRENSVLSRAKTWRGLVSMSANDPKRTFTILDRFVGQRAA